MPFKTAMPPQFTPLTRTVEQTLAQAHGSAVSAEKSRKRHLPAEKPQEDAQVRQRIVVVNDLHLGAGINKDTGLSDPSEDFMTSQQEEQFVAYLSREWAAAADGETDLVNSANRKMHKTLMAANPAVALAHASSKPLYQLTLCINGDGFDFLQMVDEIPGLGYPDGYNDRLERDIKNTPANVMVQLEVIHRGHEKFFKALAMHLYLGHKLDYLPGNHDHMMSNPHVWGKFKAIMEQELKKLGADAAKIADCMGHLECKPMAFYGDVLVSHGHETDRNNRLQRPLVEFVAPTQLHAVGQYSLGDHGVRKGFNNFEPYDPQLDNLSAGSPKFIAHALRHPVRAMRLIAGFIKAFAQEGYTSSPAQERSKRIEDMRAISLQHPEWLASINSCRSVHEQLSLDQFVEGMVALEEKSATPLYSNFKEGSGVAKRLFAWIFQVDRQSKRSEDGVLYDRFEIAHNELGINVFIHGHTHVARRETLLARDGTQVDYMNTATWLTKGEEGSDRSALTWGLADRGVGVIEMGVDATGKAWRSARLERVVGVKGDLVRGEIYASPEESPAKLRQTAEVLFAANHARVNDNSTDSASSLGSQVAQAILGRAVIA